MSQPPPAPPRQEELPAAEIETPPALPARSSQRDSISSAQLRQQQTLEKADRSAPAPLSPRPAQGPQQPIAQTLGPQAIPNLAPYTPQPEPVKTKRDELRAGDGTWTWKTGFRTVAIIVGLIGIGCAASTVARYTSDSFYSDFSYDFYIDDIWTMPWTLITFSVSVIWSAVCIIVFFARKPNAPVHPGAQVGVDLILWIAFIFTGILAVVGTSSVARWGSDGDLGWSGSGSGSYILSSTNNTWTWYSSQTSSNYGYNRPCDQTSSSSSYSFPNCEAQDAYVNAVWHDKPHRYNVNLTATVCQFISLVVHFILFVWACVDTHRRNTRGSVSKDAEKLAADIVMNMVKSGAIIPAPGQAHFSQQVPPGMIPVYPQQYAQQWPQQFPPQQHPQRPVPAQYPQEKSLPVPREGDVSQQQPTVVASGSDEKKATGARYA